MLQNIGVITGMKRVAITEHRSLPITAAIKNAPPKRCVPFYRLILLFNRLNQGRSSTSSTSGGIRSSRLIFIQIRILVATNTEEYVPTRSEERRVGKE